MSDDNWAIPTGYMNDIRNAERFKTIKAMLPILRAPEQKALWLEELEKLEESVASFSGMIDREE